MCQVKFTSSFTFMFTARVTFRFTAKITFKFTPQMKLSLTADEVLADLLPNLMCSVRIHSKLSAEFGHCSSLLLRVGHLQVYYHGHFQVSCQTRVIFKFTARATFKFTPPQMSVIAGYLQVYYQSPSSLLPEQPLGFTPWSVKHGYLEDHYTA